MTPCGDLIAVPDRGMFWGSRGVLHDPAGRLTATPAAGPGPLPSRAPPPAPSGPLTVITPRAAMAVLAAGYQPVVHPTAGVRRL